MADGNFSERFVMVADSRRRTALSGERQTIAVGDTQYRLREGISAENRLFQYYALRYGSIMVGVLMLRGLCTAAEMNLHESIVNELTLSLETIRQRLQLLNRLNEEAEQSVCDGSADGAEQPLRDRPVRPAAV